MPETYFAPLPDADLDFDQLLIWLREQTISVQKLISGEIQAIDITLGTGGTIQSANFVSGSAGWQIDGDGNAEFNAVVVRGDIESGNWDGASPANLASRDGAATAGFYLDSSVGSAQFEGDIWLGGSFEAEGDIYSGNWNGAIPADLSSGAVNASAGFYLDGSSGAAQFTGPVYFVPPDESTAGQGTTLNFGDGFALRVYQDNPVAGDDTLWIFGNAGDHVVIGPTSSANLFEKIRLRADVISPEGGYLDINKVGSSSNLNLRFSEGYRIFNDNVGAGSHNTRWWFDTPNGAEMIFGPRTSADKIHSVRVRANALQLEWTDSGGDAASHAWPKGIVYDFGYVSSTGGVSFSSLTTVISAAVSVPPNISVTVLIWAWANWDNSGHRVHNRSTGYIAGATGLLNIQENNFTTTSDGHDHVHDHQGATGSADGHFHSIGTTDSGASDAHTHNMSAQWKHLMNTYARSFTPTGSSITVALQMETTAGTQTAANKELMWMVVVN